MNSTAIPWRIFSYSLPKGCSQRASSPIWASEVSLARTREQRGPSCLRRSLACSLARLASLAQIGELACRLKGWKTAYRRARWYCNTAHTKITKTTLEKEAQYCNTINNLVWNWKPCNCMKNLELAPWVHWEWKGWNSCGNVATTGI